MQAFGRNRTPLEPRLPLSNRFESRLKFCVCGTPTRRVLGRSDTMVAGAHDRPYSIRSPSRSGKSARGNPVLLPGRLIALSVLQTSKPVLDDSLPAMLLKRSSGRV